MEPSPDSLAAIRSRTQSSRARAWYRQPWFVGVASAGAATAATIVAVTLATYVGVQPDRAAPASQAPVSKVTVPVYYLGNSTGGTRLFQEIRQVPAPDGKAVAAVRAALQRQPKDPNYSTPWHDTGVNSVRWQRHVIAVDLTGEASAWPLADATKNARRVAIQQLVYTAQAALNLDRPVLFTVDGEPVDELLGLPADRPIPRSDPLSVQAMVQITEPSEGAVVTSPVVVRGVANVFEENVNRQVLGVDGRVVRDGFTMTKAAYEFSPFEETIRLPPGDYTLRFFEASAKDGRPTYVDTKAITVR